MAKELHISGPSGNTVYAVIVNSSGNVYNGTGVEPYVEGNYGNYDVPMPEFGTTGIFQADLPSTLTAGSDFLLVYKLQSGGSPDPTDTIIGSGSHTIEGDARGSLMAALYGTGQTMDALIVNSDGLVWNGATYEALIDANYLTYLHSGTELGTSGIYLGDFPPEITSGGPFTIYWKARVDPLIAASTDPVANINTYAIPGEDGTLPTFMNGEDWLTYLRRGFIRTDKDQELLDATKDTIADIRRRIVTEDYQTETTVLDPIITLGNYAMDLESRFGILVSDVVLMDTTLGRPLNKISKGEYDRRYRRYGTDQSARGVPRDFCIFNGQILVGPVPDRTTYIYKINYAIDDHAEITTETLNVPYTNKFREIIKHGVYSRVYSDLKNDDQAAKYGTLYESGIGHWTRKEDRNRRGPMTTRYRGC